ncbi:Uncharacterized protein TCM_036717 [Theobroma cacao]|uniref:Uncharacterized protein n=1 Tax=Theobroma cacao TaxID=3641 RepID=A0A061FK98_THECC|nr:Uncharacterized protein TCM_036717 [Theobroma cacao]
MSDSVQLPSHGGMIHSSSFDGCLATHLMPKELGHVSLMSQFYVIFMFIDIEHVYHDVANAWRILMNIMDECTNVA